MIKFSNFSLVLVIILSAWSAKSKASHVNSAEISYVCTGPCDVRVSHAMYLHCPIGSMTFTAPVTVPQTPGCPTLTLTPFGNFIMEEVTPLCPGQNSNCSPGSSIPGVERWVQQYDVSYCSAPANCIWTFDWQECCRSGAITSGQANSNYGLVSTTLNNSLATCNNSPQFTAPLELFICQGQPMTVATGAVDPDGDSLAYNLGPCFGAPPYVPGYSVNLPLGSSWGITYDAVTGNMQLTPQPGNLAVGVTCVYVEEWRNGALINTYSRDWMLTVVNCSGNANPLFTAYSNISPGATVTGDEFTIGAGSQLCFDIGATDVNPQSLQLYWLSGPTGATFTDATNVSITDTVTGLNPVGRFCFTPSAPGHYQFFVMSDDANCPLTGRARKQISINVVGPTTSASAQAGSCFEVQFAATVSGNLTGLTYQWSGAGGLSGTTANVGHIYPGPGSYPWEVIVSNGSFLNDTIRDTVVVAPAEITGTIQTSTLAPLANQKVYLIRHDASLSALYAEDSTFTDAFGNYFFCGISLDTMYIKAAPDSATYPTEMPTYADTAIFWNNAEMVLAANFPAVKSFQTRFGSNPGGPGFLGGLISQGANKRQAPGDPMPGVRVFLYSTTLDQFVGETESDANGYFSFASIPLGDYEVSVDVAGVDHIIVPSVLLDAATPVQDSLDFRLHTTYFELVLPTAVSGSGLAGLNLEVFPNPSSDMTQLTLDLPETGEVRLEVYDFTGKMVHRLVHGQLTAGKHQWTLDDKVLQTGLYFVKLQSNGQTQVLRMLRTE